MWECLNTIVCAFDLKSPHIMSFEIHEWIYSQMCLKRSGSNNGGG